MRRLFNRPARRMVEKIGILVNDGGVEAAHEALRLLALIPEDHLRALWGLEEIRVTLLQRIGLVDEARREALRFLAARGDEGSWMQHGGLLCNWMAHATTPDVKRAIVDELRHAIAACDNVIPRLMLGIMLIDRNDGHDVDRLEGPLLDPIWDTNRKLFDLWRVLVGNAFTFAMQELCDSGHDERARKLARRAADLPWRGQNLLRGEALNDLLGTMYVVAGNEPVVRIARDLVRAEPAPPEAHFWLALDARTRREDSRAIRHLRKAAGASIPLGLDYDAIASYLVHHDEFDLALWIVEQAVERDHPPLLYAEARALLGLDRVEEACEVSARLWAARPISRKAFLLYHDTLHRSGRQDEAECWLREVMSDPENLHADFARLTLAQQLLRTNRADEALQILDPLLQLPPHLDESSFAHSVLGDTLAAHGRHREALLHVERAARLDPSPLQSARLIIALLQAERNEEAETEASMALKLWPDVPPLVIASVFVADTRGMWSDALTRLEALGDPWKTAPQVHHSLVSTKVRALVELGRPMDALMVFESQLDVVLADDELSALRTDVLEEVQRRFEQLERSVAREHRRLRDHREASKREAAELRRSAERKRAEIRRLLREQARPETSSVEDDDQSWEAASLPGGLTAQQEKLVQSAERAWT
ncbi:MAG: hypothetical protein ACOC1F_13790, partial [Myxococcota bacterium]